MAASNTPSPGRKGDKIIRDALIAVQRQQPERLKRIAEAWWDAAETDQVARNALADRLDGKAVQPISGDDENPLMVITRIERHIVDTANQDS